MSAVERGLRTVTIPSGSDLSAIQYHFVDVDSGGQIIIPTAAGAKAIGVLQNTPAAADADAIIGISGISSVVAGGTIAAGALVQAGADGTALAVASGDYALGTAVTGGAIGDILEVLLLGGAGNITA